MFRLRPPRRSLRPLIDTLWRYDATAAGLLVIPPDGCTDLIWDGRILHVSAPTVGPVEVLATGAQSGLRLRPGAVAALTVGSRRPLAEVLAERLDEAGAVRRLQAVPFASTGLEDVVAALLDRRPPEPSALALAGALIRPCHTVDRLAQRLGMTPRTLRRHLPTATGLAPKQTLRILRFQRVLRLRERLPRLPLSDLAAFLGYADQAHMTREVRAYSGLSPTALAWSRTWPFCSRPDDAAAPPCGQPFPQEASSWTSASP